MTTRRAPPGGAGQGATPRLKPLALRMPRARPLTIGLEVLAGTVVLGLVLLGGLHLKLSYGPIDAGFLVKPIETAINAEIAPLTAKIGGAVIRYEDGQRDVRFRLENVTVRGEDGGIVAVAPAAGISLSASALMSGQLAPSSIDLIRPQLKLEYSERSGLALGGTVDDVPDAVPGPAVLAELPEVDAENLTQAGSGEAGKGGDARFRLSVAETISAALVEARRQSTASSYLTGLGLVDAEVLLVTRDGRSQWHLPRLAVKLEHREKRSIITGAGQAATKSGPVAFGFSAEESEKQAQLTLTAKVSNLVPQDLAEYLPGFGGVGILALPVSGESAIVLSTSGEIEEIKTSLDLGQGALALASIGIEPIALDDGKLRLHYVSEEGRIEILPSLVRAGRSQATITGNAVPRRAGGAVNLWEFDLSLADTQLGDPDGDQPVARLDDWTIRGAFVPKSGLLAIERMRVKGGGGSLELAGRASASMGLGLNGVATGFPVELFKRLWPRGVATPTRDWVMENLTGGRITEGHIAIALRPEDLATLEQTGEVPENRFVAGVAVEDVHIGHMPGLPAIAAERASLKLNGSRFESEVPHGVVTLASGRTIELVKGRFDIAGTLSSRPVATTEFQTDGDVEGAVELLSSPGLALAQKAGFSSGDITGKLTGAYRLSFPLVNDLGLDEIKVTGNARIEEMKTGKSLGPFDMQGGTLDLVVTEKALDASGKILLDGVPAEIGWSQQFEGDGGVTPLKLSAVLDAADREQLGLSVNHVIIGEVPVTMTLLGSTGQGQQISVEADLTPAEVLMENVAWRKPAGQDAKLSFNVDPIEGGGARLEDFKIIGKDIDIRGQITLDRERQLAAFSFAEFSINFLTHLAITGKVRDNIWKVTATGSSYDGRTLFRSFFSAGQLTDTPLPEAKSKTGIDLTASIDTMIGFEDSALKGVRMTMSRRDGRLKALDVSGSLASGRPITVRLTKGGGGQRELVAETRDAGNAFRLIGFYSNVEGGDAVLKVNLDGLGNAEKTGTLWTREFALLGDPVVKKVLARSQEIAEGSRAGGTGKAERQRLYFNRLKVPFSVGSGQLVLHESYINGPSLGATLRGRVDFNRDFVQLSGTYVPLYGLNAMLGSVPILGEILTGGQGGGVVGITFSIQGHLKDPQVGVNPVSALTPGIFRQIFETDPGAGGIQKRKPAGDAKGVVPTTSSLPAQTEGASTPSIGEAMAPQTAPTKSKKPKKSASETDWEAQSN
ncbi:MAG: AsmA-like C-terminal region-containing protein [Hyphomicrobiaceae bacterium]